MVEMPERIWAERDDETNEKRWYSIKGMGVEYVRADEPDLAKSIADVVAEESASGAAAGWRSCTGCHETNEGYETGHYPYSKMFGCFVGSGCSECGGLGVVWEYWSKEALEAMLEDDPALSDAVQSKAERDVEPVATVAEVHADGKRLYNTTYPSNALDKLPVGTPLYTFPPTSELEALRKRVAELEKALEKSEELFNAISDHIDEHSFSYAKGFCSQGAFTARRVREGGKVE